MEQIRFGKFAVAQLTSHGTERFIIKNRTARHWFYSTHLDSTIEPIQVRDTL